MSAVLKPPKTSAWHTRTMMLCDLPQVLQTECACYHFPWSLKLLQSCIDAGYHCEVIATDSLVIAHSILACDNEEAHLLNLCVHPEYQRCGIGSLILRNCITQLQQKNIPLLYLEVRPSNTAALRLYRRFQFRRIGIRRDYYRAKEGREDAIILARNQQPGDRDLV